MTQKGVTSLLGFCPGPPIGARAALPVQTLPTAIADPGGRAPKQPCHVN